MLQNINVKSFTFDDSIRDQLRNWRFKNFDLMITGAWNDVKTFILRGGQLWFPIKTDVLKNFTAYTGKHLCSSFFLIKAYSFLYLWNFLENLFWRASAWDCYCIFNFLMISFEKFTYHPVTNMLLWVFGESS